MNAVNLLLAGAIIAGYGWALWRLLRREPPSCLWTIALLMLVSLLLRLIAYTDYPGGLNSDEPGILAHARNSSGLLSEGPSILPTLIPILFEAQIAPLVGFGRWAIRLYSLLGSVLSVPATFAVARAMRMRPISALVAAALVVFLPWSMLYGRISQGGELLFNQLLLLAAVARLVWKDGTWREVLFGALGLCLLFYDYYSGRSMLAMPFVGAVLAKGRARWMCLAIALIAMIGFLPQAIQPHPHAFWGLSLQSVDTNYDANPLETFRVRGVYAVSAFALPVAMNGWMTVNTAAVHPWIVLALAIVGLMTERRRALFLLAGFVVGIMPGVVSQGVVMASTHRMLSAFVFVSLAAGAAFDLVPMRQVRVVLASLLVAYVGYWSVTYYFSSDFWTAEATWQFDKDSTDLVESVAPDERYIVDGGLESFLFVREDLRPRVVELSAEKLFLDTPGLYLFQAAMVPLRAFYEGLVPSSAIQRFGKAFSVRAGYSDMTWMKGHGWLYQATCAGVTRSGNVPTLFHFFYSFSDFRCEGPVDHVWKGRWRGPAAHLRLRFSGDAWVETSPGAVFRPTTFIDSIDFDVEPGASITVHTSPLAMPNIGLYVVMPTQERLPYWEWVDPVGGAPLAAAGAANQ